MNRDYWPTQEWRAAHPESVGIDVASLSHLERQIRVRYRDIDAFLMVRNGYLVFERYYHGTGQDDKHQVASVTKSFISALVGIAIDQGFIEGVHQTLLEFFPEYFTRADDHLKRQVTIKHLLTMTAGFQWRTGTRAHELFLDRMRRSKDWVAFILGLPLREGSVGTFQYNSAASHLLSAMITCSTGLCAQDFADEHLFKPLGIDPPPSVSGQTFNQEQVFRNQAGGWPKDPQGHSTGGWGLALTPRDMARFGFLYLNGGHWDDVQVLPRQWVQDSITPHTPGYGYQWWLRGLNGVFVFSAVGQGGQHIFCMPGEDLVVVVTSKLSSRWRDRWALLEEHVIPAVRG